MSFGLEEDMSTIQGFIVQEHRERETARCTVHFVHGHGVRPPSSHPGFANGQYPPQQMETAQLAFVMYSRFLD